MSLMECRTCGDVFGTTKEVRKHVFNRHMPTNVWPLVCPVSECRYFCQFRSDYDRHRKSQGHIARQRRGGYRDTEPRENPNALDLEGGKFYQRVERRREKPGSQEPKDSRKRTQEREIRQDKRRKVDHRASPLKEVDRNVPLELSSDSDSSLDDEMVRKAEKRLESSMDRLRAQQHQEELGPFPALEELLPQAEDLGGEPHRKAEVKVMKSKEPQAEIKKAKKDPPNETPIPKGRRQEKSDIKERPYTLANPTQAPYIPAPVVTLSNVPSYIPSPITELVPIHKQDELLNMPTESDLFQPPRKKEPEVEDCDKEISKNEPVPEVPLEVQENTDYKLTEITFEKSKDDRPYLGGELQLRMAAWVYDFFKHTAPLHGHSPSRLCPRCIQGDRLITAAVRTQDDRLFLPFTRDYSLPTDPRCCKE